MSTPAQIDANRENAQHSTGPVTEAGKQRSALNALSHGMYSRHLLLPAEDPAELEQLRAALIESHAPADGAELVHVERIIACQWKLLRLQKLEARAMQRTVGRELLRALEMLSRMEQRLDSMILKAEKALRDLRAQKPSSNQGDTAARNDAIVRNEPNSAHKPLIPEELPAEPDAMTNLLERLEHQINRVVPAFAAASVLKNAPNSSPMLVQQR